MTFPTTILLGSIAGLTIFLGLPIARVKDPSNAWKAFLNAVAIGILVFLLWDILTKASEPIEAAVESAASGPSGYFLLLIFLFMIGIGIGLLGLTYFERWIMPSSADVAPAQLALMIAVGIGFHNFSEGLAIGQAARAGAIGLAAILIIGFGLHNMTEGFGIAAPLTIAQRPSWLFLAWLGFIGGGPTFLGTMIGYSVQSEPVFVLFLALAAGSILYVIMQLLNIGRTFKLRQLTGWGIFLGFLAGYLTDLILLWAGA